MLLCVCLQPKITIYKNMVGYVYDNKIDNNFDNKRPNLRRF